jgi:hypothetical protein
VLLCPFLVDMMIIKISVVGIIANSYIKTLKTHQRGNYEGKS